jgi:hypothetical protein
MRRAAAFALSVVLALALAGAGAAASAAVASAASVATASTASAVTTSPATASRPGSADAAAAARARAERILSERRFHASKTPRPLHGVLVAIGKAVRAVLDPIGRLIDRAGRHVPGGTPVLWLLLAGVVVAAAAVLTTRSVRRRGAAVERLRGAAAGGRSGGLDPDALEREAEGAERGGDLEHALRLRFRAGLLRLDRAEAIRFRPSITTTEVAGALRSRSFDELALTFEEVAYGGRPAEEPDVEAARRRWPELLAEVGGR